MYFSLAYFFGLVLSLVIAVHAKTHYVQVGDSQGAIKYTPDHINAKSGDYVTFQFQQKNHTATESSFHWPCAAKKGGFDSGFMFVPPDQKDNFPTYTIPVKNDHKPIWVYCRQGGNTNATHCGRGMVFAVNAKDHGMFSFNNFKHRALEVGKALGAPQN